MASDINLRTLRTARTVRKLSVEEVSAFTKISDNSIRKFEAGEKDPSFSQLEKLGELYNISPLAFYAQETPEFDSTLPDFRRQAPTAANVSPRGLRRIWDIENRAKFTKSLLEALGKSAPELPSFRRLTNKRTPSPDSLRAAFESWLGVVAPTLRFGDSPEAFFKYLRLFIDRTGCATSVNTAPIDDYLGFFKVSGRNSKSVFVNREIRNSKRSLFTLAHEFAHLLHDAEGISNPFVARNEVERESNQFAVEFLAPTDEIQRLVAQYRPSTFSDPILLINAVSRDSLLSRQAAALRLNDLDYITKKDTNAFFAMFARSRRETPTKTESKTEVKGRNVVVGKRLSEVGVFPAFVASLAIENGLVDFVDVERGLGVSESIQADVLSLARRRLEASLD